MDWLPRNFHVKLPPVTFAAQPLASFLRVLLHRHHNGHIEVIWRLQKRSTINGVDALHVQGLWSCGILAEPCLCATVLVCLEWMGTRRCLLWILENMRGRLAEVCACHWQCSWRCLSSGRVSVSSVKTLGLTIGGFTWQWWIPSHTLLKALSGDWTFSGWTSRT
jgi:hypothetical protein